MHENRTTGSTRIVLNDVLILMVCFLYQNVLSNVQLSNRCLNECVARVIHIRQTGLRKFVIKLKLCNRCMQLELVSGHHILPNFNLPLAPENVSKSYCFLHQVYVNDATGEEMPVSSLLLRIQVLGR